MFKDVKKIFTIIAPTIIIASPVNSLNCGDNSTQVNTVQNEPVKIPYDDGFKSLVPDFYVCPYSCNSCRFKIKKFDSYYQIPEGGACTLLGCPPSLHEKEEKTIDYKLCFENWIFSDSLSYNNLSLSLERCINGYRNITYVKQQQILDKNFSLEDSQTLEHTYLALGKGISACKKLFKSLEEGRFNKREISSFSMYLENRYFMNPFRDCYFSLGEEPKGLSQLCFNSFDKDKVKSQKEILNYLSKNYHEKNEIITNELIEQFKQEYQKYLSDKRTDRRKKRREFWNKLLDFIAF
ncbi:MAG: hypothetical protein AAGA80_14870 [Cyanobacteria bacterium P01_F01_bin.143]